MIIFREMIYHNEDIPSKMELLLAIFQLQQRASALLSSSEDLKNRGDLLHATPECEQLADALRRQLELSETHNRYYPNSPFELQPVARSLINTLMVQADLVEAKRDLRRAEALREEALRLSAGYLGEVDTAERERQRAASLISQGRFNEALVALAAARDIFQKQGNALALAIVTANIAGVLEWLGDYERALAEVGQAFEFIEAFLAQGQPSESNILTSLLGGDLEGAEQNARLWQISLELAQIRARSNRYLGNFGVATRQFQEIMPHVPGESRSGIAFQLAAIDVARGRYAEGLEVLNQLEPAFTGLLRPKLGVLLSFKGEALLGLGSPGKALPYLKAAVQDLFQYTDPDSLWKSQWRVGRALQALQRPQEALAAYSQAIETINLLRKAPLGYRLDSTYLRDKLPAFASAIDLACESDQAEACCRFMEAIKSRALTATLSIPAREQPERSHDFDHQLDDLTRQLDALEYAAYRDGWTDEIEAKRATLLSERANLLERAKFSDPRWRSLTEPLPFDLDAVLEILEARGQAALSLFVLERQVLTVLLKDGRCLTARQHLAEETQAALEHYQQNLQAASPQSAWFDPAAAFGLEARHLLPEGLLEPAMEAGGLLIAPHGSLHLLPWAGLFHQGKRLFERCPVGIVPNLSCLTSLQADLSESPRAALVGGLDYKGLRGLKPLFLSPLEIQTIEEIYLFHGGIVGQALKGNVATEAAFWQLAKHPDAHRNILHIASHGVFVTGEPLNSGLLLTDGKIDATEIARAGLQYDEVVLSACSTGYRPTEVQGVALSGDDILGLPGALLEAGVRSVLVSIPPARDDATLRFMTLYHESRAEGVSPLFSLQRAQMGMLEGGELAPYLWIGFTLYGCQ